MDSAPAALAESRTALGHRQAGAVPDGEWGWIFGDERAALDRGAVWFEGELLSPQALAAAREGRFLCGADEFSSADADDYHSRLGHEWRLALGGFRAISTAPRATTLDALRAMAVAEEGLERLFGTRPGRPATVVLLRSVEQYNAFALLGPELGGVASAVRDFSAFHHSFPAESWVDLEGDGSYPGAAVGFWDVRSDAGGAWGPFSARFAAALAFAEALDPSPVTIAARLNDPFGPFDSAAFWEEKHLPLWLRYGAASYVERWAPVRSSEDPEWAARWSGEALEEFGGLPDLDALFAFEAWGADVGQAAWLVLASGRLVAELLDAGHAELEAAHAEFVSAMRAEAGVRAAVQGLERALRDHFESEPSAAGERG